MALFVAKEHLNVKELSQYTSRYVTDVTPVDWATTHHHTCTCILYLGPTRKQADFLALTVIHRKSSSNSQRLISDWRAQIDGANNIISSAYRNIPVQIVVILHPVLVFRARRNAVTASAVLAMAFSSVRLSVCLSIRSSVTRRYCVKTTARSTVQFTLSDSKMCLVL